MKFDEKLLEAYLRIINPKQQLRFRKALDYKSAFFCLGYQVNSSNDIEVHGEYLFDR